MSGINISFQKIKLIVYDFDGVMTNNKVFVNQNGEEMVQVNRADGLGVSEIKKLGIKQIILSTEKNYVVKSRAKKLKIDCIYGVKDKKKKLIHYCKENNIQFENVAYIGNDINDKLAMQLVEFSFCPADAHREIKDISRFVFNSKGGDGVIRELFEHFNVKGE